MDDTQRTGWQKRILLFLTSQCITLFGSTLVQMALVWYATMQTSSGVWVAAFTVCSYLPQFLISFIGGVWADRYHRKKLIIGADLLIAFVTFVMVLAIPHISSEPALLGGLLVMSVIRSLGAGIQTPAVNAVIPQLVPEDQLMRYNGINATMQSIVNFAAPAAAGAVFAISTLRMTLMIDIVTAILGTGLLSCLALPKQNTSIEKASVFSDMKIGVKYAFAEKLIGKLLIIYGLFTFFCVPAGYLAGLLVRRVFGDTYWYLTAVEVVGFAGMMAGGVIMSTWGGFKHRGKTLAVGLFAFGSFAIGMGFSKNFIFYLGLMVCYGVALTMVQTAIKDLYPDVYKNDHFVEVTEDVLETIRAAERAEAAYDRRMYRYKAHYSLDCDNGIENAILTKPQTPEMLLEEKQLREKLYAAVMALPEKQAKRIYARYYLGMTVNEIAEVEGVDPSRVRDSIRRGLKQLAKYF